MTLLFTPPTLQQKILRATALPMSIGFHGLIAVFLIQAPKESEKKKETWIEMQVVEKPKPEPEVKVEEPKPEPKPEPVTKPKPKKKKKKKKPKKKKPPEPPPKKPKKLRRVQGLKASSFAKNGNTGLTVRAGTTLDEGASKKTLSIEDAKNSTAIPFASATTQPRLKRRPQLKIPDSVKEQGIEGVVKIVINISNTGRVTRAKVTRSLSPDADKACLESWKKAKFQPAKKGDQPTAVSNFPRRCRYKAAE